MNGISKKKIRVQFQTGTARLRDRAVIFNQKSKEMNDPVNHPSHYTDGKIEVINFIEDKKMGYHLGNAIKYISRAGKKDKEKTAQDLEKAIWYIKRHIETQL